MVAALPLQCLTRIGLCRQETLQHSIAVSAAVNAQMSALAIVLSHITTSEPASAYARHAGAAPRACCGTVMATVASAAGALVLADMAALTTATAAAAAAAAALSVHLAPVAVQLLEPAAVAGGGQLLAAHSWSAVGMRTCSRQQIWLVMRGMTAHQDSSGCRQQLCGCQTLQRQCLWQQQLQHGGGRPAARPGHNLLLLLLLHGLVFMPAVPAWRVQVTKVLVLELG